MRPTEKDQEYFTPERKKEYQFLITRMIEVGIEVPQDVCLFLKGWFCGDENGKDFE